MSITNPLKGKTTLEYDRHGNLVKKADEKNNTTYNLINIQIGKINFQYEYNANREIIAKIDSPLSITTLYGIFYYL